MKKYVCFMCMVIIVAMYACKEEQPIIEKPDEVQVGEPESGPYSRFYLLNEGQMDQNNSSLDFYDFTTGVYTRNIFSWVNKNVIKGLGDVGNDMEIYGAKLYAVINMSNKLEILNAKTAQRIKMLDIENCRHICFHDGFAYITSYAGSVDEISKKQLGYVAKIDTLTLEVVAKCVVGCQPNELKVVHNKLYVANSGGYTPDMYDNTLSVIDIATFTETGKIKVADNLHRVRTDKHNNVWITSYGNYLDVPAKLYCLDPKTDTLTDSIDVPISSCTVVGDSIYACAISWNNITTSNEVSYAVIDVVKKELVSTTLVTDETISSIKSPYGIAVNPHSKDFYVTDAGDYKKPGMLYSFSKAGKLKWKLPVGVSPAHIIFM